MKNSKKSLSDGIGKEIKITLEYQENKVRRNIDIESKILFNCDSEEEQQEQKDSEFYKNLHLQLSEIEKKYK